MGISAYVTPILMGGGKIVTLPILTYQQIGGSFDPHYASAIGIVLLCLCLLILFAHTFIVSRLARAGGTP